MLQQQLRKCTLCGKSLPLDFYYVKKNGKPAYGWCKKCHIKHVYEYENTPNGKYAELKKDAKKHRIKFDLTISDIEEMYKKPCVYCGRRVRFISMDRIDNDSYYHRNNVDVCCRWCNYTKGTGSAAFFYNQCRRVVEHTSEKLKQVGDVKDTGKRYENSFAE